MGRNKEYRKVLILRFSAMGDVAMTIPVVYSLAAAYPGCRFFVLSRPQFEGFFEPRPDNVSFVGADLQEYKGIIGLYQLFRKLRREGFDAVADLHSVLRSHLLCLFFRLSGVPCQRIDKGRQGKKELTRRNHKLLRPLKTSFERYREVFQRLGFRFDMTFRSIYQEQTPAVPDILPLYDHDYREHTLIGIAPFAKHEGKIYPIGKMEKVVEFLSQREDTRVFLFGGGTRESEILQQWEDKYPNTLSCARKLPLSQEIALLHYLDLAVSMDSANMHLASLAGTSVLSVWGATHPFAGFLGWNQKETLQLDLPCRPCSVFGNKPCFRGDYACMQDISPEMLIGKIDEVLERNRE